MRFCSSVWNALHESDPPAYATARAACLVSLWSVAQRSDGWRRIPVGAGYGCIKRVYFPIVVEVGMVGLGFPEAVEVECWWHQTRVDCI